MENGASIEARCCSLLHFLLDFLHHTSYYTLGETLLSKTLSILPDPDEEWLFC